MPFNLPKQITSPFNLIRPFRPQPDRFFSFQLRQQGGATGTDFGRTKRNRLRDSQPRLAFPFVPARRGKRGRGNQTRPPPPPVLELRKNPAFFRYATSVIRQPLPHYRVARLVARIVHQVAAIIPNSFFLPQKSKGGGQIEEPIQPARVPGLPADRFRGSVCVRRELSARSSQNQRAQ